MEKCQNIFYTMEERLRQITEYYGISIRQFEQKISASDGLIHKAIARKSGLKSDTIAKILDVFPQISPIWLITGKGDMIQPSIPQNQNDHSIDNLVDKISTLSQEIGKLKAENEMLKKEIAHLENVVKAAPATGVYA